MPRDWKPKNALKHIVPGRIARMMSVEFSDLDVQSIRCHVQYCFYAQRFSHRSEPDILGSRASADQFLVLPLDTRAKHVIAYAAGRLSQGDFELLVVARKSALHVSLVLLRPLHLAPAHL